MPEENCWCVDTLEPFVCGDCDEKQYHLTEQEARFVLSALSHLRHKSKIPKRSSETIEKKLSLMLDASPSVH